MRSRVQPPVRAPAEFFSKPFEAETPGAGQVLSVAAMTLSISKGLSGKALTKGVAPVVSVQLVASGEGEVRFTSFCSRQA